MDPCDFFTDEMVQGNFVQMKHEHTFKTAQNGTIMIYLFSFTTPDSVIGRLCNFLFLTSYMRQLLEQRNEVIKRYAESEL